VRNTDSYFGRNFVALDGLRGLAILSVMVTHFDAARFGLPLVDRAMMMAKSLGWVGVDLFFVLSGFLITGILLDTLGCANYWRSFYGRRALRIFPLYYTFLLFAWLVFPSTVVPEWTPLRGDWWMYPIYLTNWLPLWKGHWPNILGHFWSLSVEEQFYLVWPFLILLAKPRRLLWMLASAEVLVLFGRSWWVFHYGYSDTILLATITRMDGLLFGAACAAAVRQFRFPRSAETLLPMAGAVFLGAFLGIRLLQIQTLHMEVFAGNLWMALGSTLLGAGFAAILLTAVLTDQKKMWLQTILRRRLLTQFGKYAYGIYVFHVPLLYFIDRVATRFAPTTQQAVWFIDVKIVVAFSLSYGIASLSYNYFEKRFLALKDRFRPVYLAREPNAPVAAAS